MIATSPACRVHALVRQPDRTDFDAPYIPVDLTRARTRTGHGGARGPSWSPVPRPVSGRDRADGDPSIRCTRCGAIRSVGHPFRRARGLLPLSASIDRLGVLDEERQRQARNNYGSADCSRGSAQAEVTGSQLGHIPQLDLDGADRHIEPQPPDQKIAADLGPMHPVPPTRLIRDAQVGRGVFSEVTLQ